MAVSGPSGWVRRIQLERIRGFASLDIEVAVPATGEAPCTVVIGRNGTGKTTLLRSVALRLGGLDAARTTEGRLLSYGAESGVIALSDSRERHTAVFNDVNGFEARGLIGPPESLDADADADAPGLPSFVVSYGAGRTRRESTVDEGGAYRPADSVQSLFDYDARFISVETTLRRLGDFKGESWYQATLRKIGAAIGLTPQDKIELPPGGGVAVSGPTIGSKVPLEAWADGYKLTLAWVMDMYAWALRAKAIDAGGDITGILLLDEVEQHLHPTMQLQAIPRLRAQFPKLQIIATTHSPLVALSVKPEELVSLQRLADGTVVRVPVPDYSGYSAEDVLADSQLFDADVYSPETNEKLRRYRELAAKPPRRRRGPAAAAESSELQTLGAELMAMAIPEVRGSQHDDALRDLLAKYGRSPQG